jgi:hypothetical protein
MLDIGLEKVKMFAPYSTIPGGVPIYGESGVIQYVSTAVVSDIRAIKIDSETWDRIQTAWIHERESKGAFDPFRVSAQQTVAKVIAMVPQCPHRKELRWAR